MRGEIEKNISNLWLQGENEWIKKKGILSLISPISPYLREQVHPKGPVSNDVYAELGD